MKRVFLTRNYHITMGGFTLIELLITLAILGIIAGIAVPVYIGQRQKSIRTEAINNLETLRLLEEQYFAENGCYYKSGGTCVTTNTTISGVTSIQVFLPAFKPGNANALYFNYSIDIGNSATTFLITASGNTQKTGMANYNNMSVDQNNARTNY